jgi:hypothetical protein
MRFTRLRREAGPSERAGFIEAPVIGPPKSASSATVPPIAIAAVSPTAGVGGDGHDHEHRKKVRIVFQMKACRSLPEGRVAPTFGGVARRGTQQHGGGEHPGALRDPVGEHTRPGEVAGKREGEADGGLNCAPEMWPAA